MVDLYVLIDGHHSVKKKLLELGYSAEFKYMDEDKDAEFIKLPGVRIARVLSPKSKQAAGISGSHC